MISVGGRKRCTFLNPPFLIGLALLGAAALLAGPGAKWLALRTVKRPLPLRLPLTALDVNDISPYRVIHRQTLDPSIVEVLETDQYVSWLLEDTSVGRGKPLQYASLFVTYYTGGSSLVPHAPDVCYLGAGYDPARPHENLELSVPSLQSSLSSLPVRVCTFAKTAVFERDEVSVVYTFSCNGRFASSPRLVRVLIHDLGNTYAYFSKVEVSFPKASREQTIEGAGKLLDRVLPVLVRDHWPDFEAAEQAAGK